MRAELTAYRHEKGKDRHEEEGSEKLRAGGIVQKLLIGKLGRKKRRTENQKQIHQDRSENRRLDDSDLVILEGDTGRVSIGSSA